MAWVQKMKKNHAHVFNFVKWTILGLLIGGIGGLLGTVFHHALHFVTEVRGSDPWVIYLLPLGGLASVALYHVLKLQDNRGTNEIIEAALEGELIRPQVAPAIFLASSITHLLGGSAGREGAALQLGGATASMLAKALHLRPENRKLAVTAGMSAVFAGLFGTPLTATIFCMEFASVGTIFSPALLPCFLAAFAASRVSYLFGVHAEGYLLDTVYSLSAPDIGRYLILAVLVSFLGVVMCSLFHQAEHLAARKVKHPYVRIFAGGVLIAAMTAMVGDQRFNGAGMDMALKAVAGTADWYSFLLKMLLTAVTLASGFKGGEIVPTFCIGATFGCVVGGLLGIDPGFAAALGLVGLFCCATNSPIASILLSVEMFSGANIAVFAFVCVVCFVLSGNCGLYASQVLQFQKANYVGRSKKHNEVSE